ncbi:MAG TPA: DUF87 domain-containing protein [Candidatus Paceibacterota bacterium]|nr:DUF87 domain-containing protein [Candidatus Paceibacterota bacterium]
METPGREKFSSPQEEIAFLRNEIARRERDLLSRSNEVDHNDVEAVGREVIREYGEHEPDLLLHKSHAIDAYDLAASSETVKTAAEKVEEIMRVAEARGIRNALAVLERVKDPFLTDEVHRHLVSRLRTERKVADLETDAPLWKVLDMTLYEVALPRDPNDEHEHSLKAIFAGMEQFYAGMQTISQGKDPRYYTLEIAVSDKRDDIIFYVAVPNEFANLFEKQALSLFPAAELVLQQNDYNIFVDGGESMIAIAEEKKHHIYPLKTHDEFEVDPLTVLLNAFSKIERDGGGASVQIVVTGGAEKYHRTYGGIVRRMRNGEPTDVAIRKSTLGGELFEGVKSLIMNSPKKKDDERPHELDTERIELFNRKMSAPVLGINIRLAVSAKDKTRAEQILSELESSFHQFQDTQGNQLVFKRLSGVEKAGELRAFSFRELESSRIIPLSITELSTIIHFPAEGVTSSPQFKQSRAKYAAAPVDMPEVGTLLGENEFRGAKRPVYLTPIDRLRHFYVIGQTGTGKTTLLKNMLIQDIEDGAGVCMIDPHGTDIVDVLSAIPPERMDDLVYFDPSNLDRSLGLNMLEYDERHPEEKTFVVNELFSIFQKLYGANPESMGPMFEQYFRNATLLVLEDPASGSTLLDIARVMTDGKYRARKLARAKNPVVIQFWTAIATKAGGEAALENIVPYIVSKFDVFTANDYMRPIIGQQRSAFDFRKLMDERKILLVNLAKGRLGEINANLIGMIIVGKLLMAALSRVDDLTMSYPPYYLYIDEFQNVTTNSIASILSEARKYKLGLTIAHQFIAQLDEPIRDAVFGNVGSLAAFRVGPEDAEFLEKQFSPTFTAQDLMNVENRNAYVRILSNGMPTPPFSIRTLPPRETNHEYAAEMIRYSHAQNGRPREEVEREIRERFLS